MKSVIFTEDAPVPIGPYSQAILAGGTLYCSGQIGADCLDGDIATQTVAVCKNISAVLRAADMQVQDVVKTTCFLVDMGHFSGFNEIYERYFAHKPARSCVAVKELPKGALVEIEAVAVCDK
ncbi:MAG: Rid family detoxifying hydrolase [Oscillospiraceae bacterium]|nr:Rid family detoxifying hydrolase [Oscillospiraceae bacterium]